ncbi:hypothetical protein AABH71_005185 [Salmonella enterica]
MTAKKRSPAAERRSQVAALQGVTDTGKPVTVATSPVPEQHTHRQQ